MEKKALLNFSWKCGDFALAIPSEVSKKEATKRAARNACKIVPKKLTGPWQSDR
ncbi:hypothetical protein ACK6D9_13175 [Hoeflea sp. Naph1]|uniref:hypothetical protein n=1 Tax=Hoeflea sp. Naph1 TaxID=3388653 RepID=UPI00398FD0F9